MKPAATAAIDIVAATMAESSGSGNTAIVVQQHRSESPLAQLQPPSQPPSVVNVPQPTTAAESAVRDTKDVEGGRLARMRRVLQQRVEGWNLDQMAGRGPRIPHHIHQRHRGSSDGSGSGGDSGLGAQANVKVGGVQEQQAGGDRSQQLKDFDRFQAVSADEAALAEAWETPGASGAKEIDKDQVTGNAEGGGGGGSGGGDVVTSADV